MTNSKIATRKKFSVPRVPLGELNLCERCGPRNEPIFDCVVMH